MKWIDVFKKHRKVSAIYREGGELQSLLFSKDQRRPESMSKKGKLYISFFLMNITKTTWRY